MEPTCYRCDAPISENATFCPACGAPQIRVAAQEPTPATDDTRAEPQAVATAPPVAEPEPDEIRWKTFLRTTWPIAAVAGVAASTIPVIGFLLLLPLSVVLGVWLYRKRQNVLLRATLGTKMGLAMGLISFAAFAALMVASVSFSVTARQEMVKQITVAASRTPEAQQAFLPLINTSQGFAAFIVILLLFAMVFFLVLTGLTGAVAAATFGQKKA